LKHLDRHLLREGEDEENVRPREGPVPLTRKYNPQRDGHYRDGLEAYRRRSTWTCRFDGRRGERGRICENVTGCPQIRPAPHAPVEPTGPGTGRPTNALEAVAIVAVSLRVYFRVKRYRPSRGRTFSSSFALAQQMAVQVLNVFEVLLTLQQYRATGSYQSCEFGGKAFRCFF